MESRDASRENAIYLEKNQELRQLMETFSVQIVNSKPKNIVSLRTSSLPAKLPGKLPGRDLWGKSYK